MGYSGISPKTPNDYTGQKNGVVPAVSRNRRPTTADYKQPETGKNYPITCLWQVSKDPTTGQEGELWGLAKIVGNVATWTNLTTGDDPGIVTITGDNGTIVTGDGSGNLDLNGVVVANSANVKPVYIAGTDADPVHKQEVQVQLSAAVAPTPGDSTKAGLSCYNEDQFTVDSVSGMVSLKGSSTGALLKLHLDDGLNATPDVNGVVTLGGNPAVNTGVPLKSVRTPGTNDVDLQLQIAKAVDPASDVIEDAGISSYNENHFDVDAITGMVSLNGGGGGAVATVSGTLNRIDVSEPFPDPVIDISASYVGQASITTLGTVTTGTWEGDTVATGFGGTGLTSYTTGDILYASDATTLAKLPIGTTGQALTVSAGGLPEWSTDGGGTVTSVSGTLNRISIGGTATDPVVDIDAAYVGQTSITTLGTVTTGTWEGNTVQEGFGGTGQSTYATGDILYASASNTLSKLAAGANGEVLTLAGGVPTWAADGGGTITSVLTDNATPQFNLVGSTSTVDFDLSNLVLGTDLPAVTTGLQNVGMGEDVFLALTSGDSNVSVGYRSGVNLTEGNRNTCVGTSSGTTITTGTQNTLIGSSAGSAISTGGGNVGIGHDALTTLDQGSNNICIAVTNSTGGLAGVQSNNIVIGSTGTNVTSNGIHIGHVQATTGQHTHAYIAGVSGVTVAASEPMAIDSNGQMSGLGFGTADQVLTSGGAGVSPSWSSALNLTSVSFDGGTNTLSEYEEGTWTPALTGAGGAPTIAYTSRFGYYVRIGSMVYYKWSITVNTISGGSGSTLITGLPFTTANDDTGVRHVLSTSRVDWPASVTTVLQSIGQNVTQILLLGDIDNASGVGLDISGVANGDFLLGTGFYWA